MLLTNFENDVDYDDYRGIEFSLVHHGGVNDGPLISMVKMMMTMMVMMMIYAGALSSHWWSKCSTLSPSKLTHTLFQVRPMKMFLTQEMLS